MWAYRCTGCKRKFTDRCETCVYCGAEVVDFDGTEGTENDGPVSDYQVLQARVSPPPPPPPNAGLIGAVLGTASLVISGYYWFLFNQPTPATPQKSGYYWEICIAALVAMGVAIAAKFAGALTLQHVYTQQPDGSKMFRPLPLVGLITALIGLLSGLGLFCLSGIIYALKLLSENPLRMQM